VGKEGRDSTNSSELRSALKTSDGGASKGGGENALMKNGRVVNQSPEVATEGSLLFK